jgi:hypothetical protein
MEGEKLTGLLRGFLESGSDWERKPTSLPGVFIVKLPPYGRSPTRLVVEINPIDASGAPTRRRGFIIRNSNELKDFQELVAEDKLGGLLRGVDAVNPLTPGRAKSDQGKEIIEI